MKINDIISGFRVVSARESRELGGTLWELIHEKTAAPLYWLDNGAENKVFSVAFKTVPWDDTGVFHILEHSVLCGSQKYPVKEPFVDLVKSSMNTFLNAMTFKDKTMYPVASRNEKDFLNLVSVYLDAVFRPNITVNPSIFLQEGTRVDFGGDAPAFNGVVYNEMKGACGSLNTRIVNETARLLYPDSPYGYVSGGDPDSIPSLTYEAFLQTYRRFYHPSNSVFYLDGGLPADTVLSMIDGYLCAYEKSDALPGIPIQAKRESVHAEVPYEIGESESAEKKTCIAVGRLAGLDTDLTRMYALRILSSYLFGSNEAPVKRAVMETGLAEDVSFFACTGIYQPFTLLVFRNTEAAHRETLLSAVRDAAAAVLREGIDPEDLMAEIDTMELNVKEPEEPQGIDRAVDLSAAVFFGADPLTYLEYDALLAGLREKINTDYYTGLIREFLADEENTAVVTFLPDPALGARNTEAEQARLDAALSAMDEPSLAAAKARYETFRAWQDTPDSEEQKATLPTLSVADVPEAPTPFVTDTHTQNGRSADFHPARTAGVSFVRLYFAADDLLPEEIPLLAFVTELLGKLPTEKHTALELDRALKRCTGWTSTSVLTASTDAADTAFCRLAAGFSALSTKLPQAIGLVGEVLTETLFTEKSKVKELLTQSRDRYYRSIYAAGSRYACLRVVAATNAEAAADDAVSGIAYYRWLKAFETDFDARFDAFAARAKALLGRFCVSARLNVSETADAFHPEVFGLYAAFPEGEKCETAALRIPLPNVRRTEAFLVPGSVSFAALGTDLRRCGARFNGEMRAMAGMLTYTYLWDEIRVRGGAYGCGCIFSDAETFRLYTYRDPSPLRSLEIFREAAAWLEGFCEGDAPIDNFIISAVAAADPLRSPADMGSAADLMKLQGKTEADRVRTRHETLAATRRSLRGYAALLRDAAETGSVCVVGCKEALQDLGDEWTAEEL